MTRGAPVVVVAVAALGLSSCSEQPAAPAPTSAATVAPVDYYRSVTSAPPGLPTYELRVTADGPVTIQFRGLEDFTSPAGGAAARDYRTSLPGGSWSQTVQGSAWDDGWVLQVDRSDAAAAAARGDTRPLSCEVTIRVPGGPVLHIADETNEPSGTATCSALAAPRPARTYTWPAPGTGAAYPAEIPAWHVDTVCAPQGLSAQECQWTWGIAQGETAR